MRQKSTSFVMVRSFPAILVAFSIILTGTDSFGELISADNRIDWKLGVTVGVQGNKPNRTNLIDVTKAPYFANNTGSSDASAAIQSAINAAVSNDVVYLPNGIYRLNSTLSLNKSYITLRGQSTNAVLLGLGAGNSALGVGHDAQSPDPNRSYIVISGATKGSTNLVLESTANAYGDVLKAGDILRLTYSTRNTGNEAFPVISIANYDNLISQTVAVHARNGNAISITAPLVWNLTNPPVRLAELATVTPPRAGIGVENLSITLTNNGSTGTAQFLINAGSLRNCWFTDLDLGFANNYQLYVTDSLNCEITRVKIHDALSYGTSHAGLILARTSGLLVQDNIFANGLFPAIEVNEAVMGCAFFGNYFTNNPLDVDMHNTHPMMNLFEANVFTSTFEMDGYFGSSSHFTLFRNRISNTLVLKRWTSFMQVVGNVCGNPGGNFVYDKEQSGYGAPYPVFEMGYPNIGNNTYVGVSPPVAWNFPGRTYNHHIAGLTTNGVFTFTGNYGPTNVIWASMGVGSLTFVPAPNNADYALVFQDRGNTNLYYGATNGGALLSVSAGTASSLRLNSYVFITNGSTLYVGGQTCYQQLQSANKYTHNLHGNLVYTNTGGTLVWMDTNPDHNLPPSLLYSLKPGWWSTNRWPAVDPLSPTPVANIPAQNRFLGIVNPISPEAPQNLRLGP